MHSYEAKEVRNLQELNAAKQTCDKALNDQSLEPLLVFSLIKLSQPT